MSNQTLRWIGGVERIWSVGRDRVSNLGIALTIGSALANLGVTWETKISVCVLYVRQSEFARFFDET